MTDGGLTFEAPGPGTWHLNDSHFPRPMTRYGREIFPTVMPSSWNRASRQYGRLMELTVELVNGYWYTSRRPILPDPPAWHPDPAAVVAATYHRRVERLAETYRTKRWRQHLQEWDETHKPAYRATLQELQATDPASLDTDALVTHLDACRDALIRGSELHHEYTPCWSFPVGDFMAHALDWTDRTRAELITLLDGATPISTGATDDLEAAAAAIANDDAAADHLMADEPPGTVLDRLRTRTDSVGAAVRSWLDETGYRVATGFDLDAAYGLEQPGLLVKTLRATVTKQGSGGAVHDVEEFRAQVREEVPPEHRATFDTLYADARDHHRVRDERETDLWAQGLVRRALLVAGDRLVEQGQLHDRDHVIDYTHEELQAALRGDGAPDATTIADRVTYRLSHGVEDAPATLGPDPTNPFEEVDLPAPAARAQRGSAALREDVDGPIEEQPEATVVRGHAASPGTYEGRARVVDGPADFEAITEGDILVAEVTSSGFNVVLPLLGAIVTDAGGLLSHPAIVAREFGIPAVVGCGDATDRIADGDELRVDGAAGTVDIRS